MQCFVNKKTNRYWTPIMADIFADGILILCQTIVIWSYVKYSKGIIPGNQYNLPSDHMGADELFFINI